MPLGFVTVGSFDIPNVSINIDDDTSHGVNNAYCETLTPSTMNIFVPSLENSNASTPDTCDVKLNPLR